jgi:hypothetical protein
MGAFLDLLSAGGKPLWLDYTAYAGRLLAKGAPPWLDAGACVAWQRKAQGLLKSSVATVAMGEICAAWLAAHPELREVMAGKRRAVFPLKTLLADETLRAHLVELTGALRAGSAGLPLVLVLPSPRRWLVLAQVQAHGEAGESDDDAIDSAAVYIADFLRAFGECGVDAVLFEEAADDQPASADAYQAALNVAGHYRWDTGLRLPAAGSFAAAGPLSFVIAPKAVPGARAGCAVPAEFWSKAAPPPRPEGGFLFAEIPAAAQPEAVLDCLALLR